MSPKIVISEDGVRYPAAFAERHGIKAAETRESPSGQDRHRTTAAVGTVVTDDAAGSVITSAAADSTSTTGVNAGLAAPETDPATAEALAAQEAGKGALGTEGATDNTTAGGTTGETTTTADAPAGDTTTENGASDGGTTSGDSAAAGDADGASTRASTTRGRSAKGK